ncbi:30S ribosomal protein S8 [Staphylococcus aureus]
MTMTDPIADMLTRVRNANMVRRKLELPASNIKKEIAEILKSEGFIKNVEYVEDKSRCTSFILKIWSKRSACYHRIKTYFKTRFTCLCKS